MPRGSGAVAVRSPGKCSDTLPVRSRRLQGSQGDYPTISILSHVSCLPLAGGLGAAGGVQRRCGKRSS